MPELRRGLAKCFVNFTEIGESCRVQWRFHRGGGIFIFCTVKIRPVFVVRDLLGQVLETDLFQSGIERDRLKTLNHADSIANAHLFGFFQNRLQEITSKPSAIQHFIRFLFIMPIFCHGCHLCL
ncbi:MAG: hypothetical protein U9N09_08575 [Euryarchaeota archaeon]|nr:hypothetical protein [Euryarchaeota archaeon]